MFMLLDYADVAIGSVVIHAHVQHRGFRWFNLFVENATLTVVEQKCNGHVTAFGGVFLLLANFILSHALFLVA